MKTGTPQEGGIQTNQSEAHSGQGQDARGPGSRESA